MRKISLQLLLLLTALLIAISGAWSQDSDVKSPSDLAILIVGDENDGEMVRKEQAFVREISKSIHKQNKISLFSYHFNKDVERNYCEKKLNILREDLLFVGLVSLKERIPRKILFRLDRIVTPARASKEIVSRSDEMLINLGVPLPGPSETPSAPTAPNNTNSNGNTSQAPSELGKWKVQLGAFTQLKSAQDLIDQLKAKGHDAKFDKVQSDNTTVYKVWVGTFASKEDAVQAVSELQNDGFEKPFATESK